MILLLAAAAAVSNVEAVDVTISGIGFTSPNAVRRFMLTRPGEPLDQGTLADDLRRLRTLGILYDVEARTEGNRVEVSAKDRWSLVPFVGLRRGGGRTTARFGISDHNLLGQLATAYAEVNSNTDVPFVQGGAYGSFVYFEVPRLEGSGFTPGVYWTRDFVDYAAYGRTGEIGYLYDRSRHDLRAELRYEVVSWLSVSTGVDVLHDRFVTSGLSRASGTPPPATDATSGFASLSLGVMEQFVSQSSGDDFKLELDGAGRGVLGSTGNAVSGLAIWRAAFIPFGGHNLLLQAQFQATSGRSDSFLFRAGGLREIRGFPDAYFEGRYLLRANAEYRIDVTTLHVLIPAVGQIAAFTDGGYVAGRDGAVAGLDYRGPIVSAGAGVRYIPVPFARAVGRLDLAVGLAPRRTFDLSFGGQQFF